MNPLRFLPFLCLLSGSSLLAQAPAPASSVVMPVGATRAKLGSKVFRWEEMPLRQTPAGERRDVAENPTATLGIFECHISTLNPGQVSHPPHRHATEEIIIIKEGAVEVHYNGNL